MFATRRMLEPDNDQGPLVSWFKAKMHDIDRIFMPMFVFDMLVPIPKQIKLLFSNTLTPTPNAPNIGRVLPYDGRYAW